MPSFGYKVGGCLQADAPNYVVRKADVNLYNALRGGEFCYIFSSRQMGKSSLLVRVKERLHHEGARCAYLDMTRLGNDGLTQAQWYAGVVMSVLQSLGLSKQVNFRQWWQATSDLTLVQRLNQLVEDVLVPTAAASPLYIFIDEIDTLLSLGFSTDDFFAWIRACYNQRAHDPRYRHLTFALFGVATPSDLIADKQRTPFNLGRAISLAGFNLAECTPLQPGLAPWVKHPQQVLKCILDWTGGQPFLTQKLCDIAVQTAEQAETLPLVLSAGMAEVWVNDLVRSHILDHWESQDEPIHLRTIRDHLFWHQHRTGRILGIYQELLQGRPVYTDDSREQVDLLLSGLVVRQGNQLIIKNRIYRNVFTAQWVERQLQRLRPYAAALEDWVASERQNTAVLLQGQTLYTAEQWAQNKSLSDLDYQFLAASQDAERQRIQQLLDTKAESERFFRQLAEAVPQIVWIVEPDGQLSYTNQHGSVFAGIPLEAIQDQPRINVIHPDDRQASLTAWEQAFATGHPYEVQLRMRAADGHYRWFLNRAVPIRDGEGNVIKWFGTSTDLDNLKRTEEAKRLKEVEARLAAQEQRLQQEQRASRLQRWLLGSVSFALVIATTLGSYAFFEKRQSALREVAAMANASEAQFASGNRLDALVTAIQAQTRLARLRHPPASLTTQVDHDLRRALFQVVEHNRFGNGKDRVYGLAISPDGQTIAAAHQQSKISLWDASGRLLQQMEKHQGNVLDVAFSPDGQTLVSVGQDGILQFWDRQGNPTQTVNAHDSIVRSVVFSPNGQLIATASEDHTVKLWNADGSPVQTFTGHGDKIWDVAFSPDGQTIASASFDNTVILWNLDGTRQRLLNNPLESDKGDNRLLSVAFSPDGTTLAAGDWYGNIIWFSRAGNVLNTASEHSKSVISLAYSPMYSAFLEEDGQTILVSGSWDDTVKFWNADGVVTKTLNAHPSGTWEVVYSPDGDQVISGGEDRQVRIWQVQPEALQVLRGHRASVWGVAFNPMTGTLASSSSDGSLKQWQPDGLLLRTLMLSQGELWTVANSPDGNIMAAGSNDGYLTLWTAEGQPLKTVKAHDQELFKLAFSPDSQAIATAGWDGAVKLWNSDGTLLQTLQPQGKEVNTVAFSPDNQWIAIGGQTNQVSVWRRLAAGTFNAEPQLELKNLSGFVWDIAFSPDSQLLATASEDNTIKLWSLDGKLYRTFAEHQDRVNAVTFIPVNSGLPAEWGTVLVSASWDHTIKFWSLDGTLRLTLEGHEDRALDVGFYPATAAHGPLLASSGLDNVVILWPLDRILTTEQVIAYGCDWVQEYLNASADMTAEQAICQSQ